MSVTEISSREADTLRYNSVEPAKVTPDQLERDEWGNLMYKRRPVEEMRSPDDKKQREAFKNAWHGAVAAIINHMRCTWLDTHDRADFERRMQDDSLEDEIRDCVDSHRLTMRQFAIHMDILTLTDSRMIDKIVLEYAKLNDQLEDFRRYDFRHVFVQ